MELAWGPLALMALLGLQEINHAGGSGSFQGAQQS
jgi:hypothetical protein